MHFVAMYSYMLNCQIHDRTWWRKDSCSLVGAVNKNSYNCKLGISHYGHHQGRKKVTCR